MNKVVLIGNLTRDPELSTTNSGKSICRFSMATRRDFKNANGEYDSDFHNIIVWGQIGENCHKFLKKGRKVAIIGSIQYRSYETKDGENRTVTEIIADSAEFLLSPVSSSGTNKEQKDTTPELTEIDGNDLPF